MANAFKCDGCGDLFEGSPNKTYYSPLKEVSPNRVNIEEVRRVLGPMGVMNQRFWKVGQNQVVATTKFPMEMASPPTHLAGKGLSAKVLVHIDNPGSATSAEFCEKCITFACVYAVNSVHNEIQAEQVRKVYMY